MLSHPLVYLIVGEPSGDMLAARLMAGLKELTGGSVDFAGVGGEAMREEGLASLFPQADLAVMGYAEVVPRIPRLLRRLAQTVADIEARRPTVVITVDSWGFNGRLVKRLKERGSTIPRLHYVAPMVWAYKANRVHQLAERVDLCFACSPTRRRCSKRRGCAPFMSAIRCWRTGPGKGMPRPFGPATEFPLIPSCSASCRAAAIQRHPASCRFSATRWRASPITPLHHG
jgi:lipid-A-disaccharide synthase